MAAKAKAIAPAEIAQLVEHNLAKVRVASSSLVFRSELRKCWIRTRDPLTMTREMPAQRARVSFSAQKSEEVVATMVAIVLIPRWWNW